MSHRKVKNGRVHVVMTFPSAKDALEWVEAVREDGHFGTVDEPEFADMPEIYRPTRPRDDVGLRELDSVDIKRVAVGNTFIVASTNDPGFFLSVEEETTENPVVRPMGA